MKMAGGTSLPASERELWWRWIVTFVVVAAVYFGTGVFDHDVWSPTEPAVSGVVWNMFRHGSLAVPRIDEFPYLEKPPLSYWLSWLSCQVAGSMSAACLRFPSAVIGVLSLSLIYWVTRKRNGIVVACVTVFFGATSIEFYQFSHRAGANILAVFFSFLCFALFARTLLRRDGRADNALAYDLGFAGALSLSFYAKNFFTFLIVLPPVLLFLLYKREFPRALRCIALVSVFTVVAVLPWALTLYREGGADYLRVVFFDNTVGRFFDFADPSQFRPGPLNDAFRTERDTSRFIYFVDLLWPPIPWSMIVLAAFIWLFRQREGDDFRLFLKIALVVVPVTLTASASRVADYLDPLLFVMLLITGDFLHELFARAENVSRLEKGLCVLNLLVIVAALVAAPIVMGFRFTQPGLFGFTFLFVLAFAVLAYRAREQWLEWRSVYNFACMVILAMSMVAVAVVPTLDAMKSYAPFFDEIRDHLNGRAVYTTLLDDRRLPLIVYYLDRRVPIIRHDEQLLELLRSGANVSVILTSGNYAKLKDKLEHIPHQIVLPSHGKRIFVLVNSP